MDGNGIKLNKIEQELDKLNLLRKKLNCKLYEMLKLVIQTPNSQEFTDLNFIKHL